MHVGFENAITTAEKAALKAAFDLYCERFAMDQCQYESICVAAASTLMLPLPLDRASISFASSFETASGRNCVSYDRAGLMNLQGPLPFLNFHNIRVQCKVFDNVVDILMHHLMYI